MRVLGIDPGTRHLGWGLVQSEGTRLTCLSYGVISPEEGAPLDERLVQIDDALDELLREQQPDAAGVESIFFSKDAQAAAKLGHARGVILLRLRRAGVPFGEYPPALVKRTVVGRGLAEKKQVALVVTALLRLRVPPPQDAADALALAITHARTSQLPRLAQARLRE